MEIITSYKRFEKETDEELVYRICSEKAQIGSWQDVANIINELTGNDFGESTYRKKFQAFKKMLEANQSKFSDSDAQLNEIRLEQRKLEKERKKIQSEKLEYSKWLREEARDELITEKICDAISSLPVLQQVPEYIKPMHTKKEYCLIFGDEHYGAIFEIKDLFGNAINSYNTEIFEDRMWDLLNQTIEILQKEQVDTLHVYSMGDFSDGCLRVSQLMKLKYGVVDGTIQYANFITNWLNELTKFVHVKFQMTDGNHTELRMLGQPKGTFTEDNMGKVVREFIKVRLQNNPNFTFIENPTGYIYGQLAGNTVMGIHGEVKDMERALKDFSAIYGVSIQYLFAGHLHHSRVEEIGINSEVINVPSIIGVDPYSLSLHKTSNASGKLVVFEENKGKVCEYTLKLN